MANVQVVLVISYATVCWAIRSQFTYYTELDCKGDGLVLESKQANVIPEAPRIIAASKSWSAAGFWMAYENVNFTGNYTTTFAQDFLRCGNTTNFQLRKSIRHIGPLETSSNSLTLHEGRAHVGREVAITGTAYANIQFTPQSLFSTGSSNWTFYSGSAFDGNSTCFIPYTDNWFTNMDTLNSRLSNVRSIVRGCGYDRKIDYYIHGTKESSLLTTA